MVVSQHVKEKMLRGLFGTHFWRFKKKWKKKSAIKPPLAGSSTGMLTRLALLYIVCWDKSFSGISEYPGIIKVLWAKKNKEVTTADLCCWLFTPLRGPTFVTHTCLWRKLSQSGQGESQHRMLGQIHSVSLPWILIDISFWLKWTWN